jgi:signal transduction histidine kinase
MTSRFTDTRRASGQLRWRGVIVMLAAIAIVAVIAMAAFGIAEQRISEDRVANQTLANAADAAETVFDRDRRVLSRLVDAAAAGWADATALPALPPQLRAIALFDSAGMRQASVSAGLDNEALASIGESVARAIASHPGPTLLIVPRIGEDGALAALAQSWASDDGLPGGIAVVAFNRAGLAALDPSTANRFNIVTADGTPLFGATTDPLPAGSLTKPIPVIPLVLHYQPQVDHAARMLRSSGPFALLALVALGAALLALAAALGLATVLIRRDRSARREIDRRASIERKLRDELMVTTAANERTDEINRAKSRFFAQVTHELRTPLNAILGFSETIRQEMFGPVTNPRYLEYAGLIHDAGSHLLSLINDLLDNARIEAGKMEIVPLRVSAAAVARSALDLVELLAEERNLTIASSGFGTCPDLNVDARAIKQVLVNLLSNAIKYTPAGGRIELRFASRAEGGVAIEVADTGHGMSAEDVLHAFEPFGRAGAEQLRRQPGTGLGLSLARALVRLHGGDLTLASRLNAGTTATVILPAKAAFGATGATPAPAKSATTSSSARAA